MRFTLAQVIAAQNTLKNNQEALRQLTGIYYPYIEGFKIELPLIKPHPLEIEDWVCAAQRYNQQLVVAEFAARAAKALIKANFGGHLPTLSAVGSYSRFKGTNFGTTNLAQGIMGLQLNIPVFQGGFVNSTVRQAQDDYATASANVQNAYLQAAVSTRQNYNNVLSGISKVVADRASIISAQSSVDSTEESFKIGTRTIVDVLIAQQQLFQVRTTYATDQYTYLLSTLQLKQSAGTLVPGDLCLINTWMHGPGESEATKRRYQAEQEKKLYQLEQEKGPPQAGEEATESGVKLPADVTQPPPPDQQVDQSPNQNELGQPSTEEKGIPPEIEKGYPHPQTKREKPQHLAEKKKHDHLADQKKHPQMADQKKPKHLSEKKKDQHLADQKKQDHLANQKKSPQVAEQKSPQLVEQKKPPQLSDQKKSPQMVEQKKPQRLSEQKKDQPLADQKKHDHLAEQKKPPQPSDRSVVYNFC